MSTKDDEIEDETMSRDKILNNNVDFFSKHTVFSIFFGGFSYFFTFSFLIFTWFRRNPFLPEFILICISFLVLVVLYILNFKGRRKQILISGVILVGFIFFTFGCIAYFLLTFGAFLTALILPGLVFLATSILLYKFFD